MDFRDIAVRAVKTALQAALAVVTVKAFTDGLSGVADWSALALAAGTAAAAAAFSVLHNAVIQWSSS